MVGPVVSIGTPGSSRYRVDYGPRMHDQALALSGIGEVVDKITDRRHEASLAQIFADGADKRDAINRAVAAGVPMEKIAQRLQIQRGLVPPPVSPFGKLMHDRARAEAAGRDVSAMTRALLS